MDFAETEDQKMIRSIVREFAETVAGPTQTKKVKQGYTAKDYTPWLFNNKNKIISKNNQRF